MNLKSLVVTSCRSAFQFSFCRLYRLSLYLSVCGLVGGFGFSAPCRSACVFCRPSPALELTPFLLLRVQCFSSCQTFSLSVSPFCPSSLPLSPSRPSPVGCPKDASMCLCARVHGHAISADGPLRSGCSVEVDNFCFLVADAF